MGYNRVWKYKLQETLFQQIAMPDGAKILSIQMQHGSPVMWVEVDPSEPIKKETRSFARVLTGYGEIPRGAKYLFTTIDANNFVSHWYEAFQS